jgi:hypothetical protein
MPGVIQAFFVNCSRVEAKEVNGCAADFSYRRFELHPCSLTQVDFFCCQIKKALSSYQAFFQKTDANIALIFSPSKFTYMKKENVSFFANMFGAKGKSTEQKTSVRITSYSQPHVLQQRMQEEQMTHGQTVTANLTPVRLEKSFYNEVVLYFCPLEKIEVLNTLSAGDGGSLPSEATIEGLSMSGECKPGLYKLCNVKITSNGTMQVMATSETTWEKI